MDAKTKITLVWELQEQGMSSSHITKHLELNRESVGNYIWGIRQADLLTFLGQYRQSQRTPRPIPLSVKRRV